jgi:UDP-2,4-diacetamido-2,4,6-trideoxy-beta-L-altropyranose hydrolase
MNIFFRVDASLKIGTGHVMRSLTLAKMLRERGAYCRFICRKYPGNLFKQIQQSGFEVFALPIVEHFRPCDQASDESVLAQHPWLSSNWQADAAQTIKALKGLQADWLVVDHYALDRRWESKLRFHCRWLMVIDDLADRPHECDILLDQSYYSEQNQRYQGLLPTMCKPLLGPSYVLLRAEFEKVRQGLRKRDGIVKRIFVFFGGSDSKNQTQKVMMALMKMNLQEISIDIIVGHSNPLRHELKMLCKKLPSATYHYSVSNMAELIANADLGIGAGGTTTWERCYLGLPTITVVLAENQAHVTKNLAEIGAIEYLGHADQLSSDDYERAISRSIANPQRLRQISEKALAIIPKQSTGSVAEEIINFKQKIRRDIHH